MAGYLRLGGVFRTEAKQRGTQNNITEPCQKEVKSVNLVRGIKVEIYPSPEQIKVIEETFGHCRFIYNHMLERNKKYTSAGKNI